MTEQNVATAMERLLGEHAPHLHDVLTPTVASRLVTRRRRDQPQRHAFAGLGRLP